MSEWVLGTIFAQKRCNNNTPYSSITLQSAFSFSLQFSESVLIQDSVLATAV